MTRFAEWPWAPPDPEPDADQPRRAIGPVWLRETQLKSTLGDTLTKRIYQCANGWGLGARRGGRLHVADAGSWEVFAVDPSGMPVPPSVGYVSDQALDSAVDRLASWWAR